MKNSSIAVLLLALAGTAPAFAAPDYAARCTFLPNAPDQHLVVRGDTLWDISGRFLKHAWCWPQVWGLNRDQIRDPHWIYPGQIVYFDRAAGKLRLGNAVAGQGAGNVPTVRLTPQVRTLDAGREAVPAIPVNAITPFLSQPLIVEATTLQDAPRIMATDENRVVLGKNDKAFVRGDLKSGTAFQVFRPSIPLKDPVTNQVIAHEAAYLGTVKLDREARAPNEAHMFTVTDLKQEMGIGDRLVPVPPAPILSYVPHPPEKPVDARIVSIYGGVDHAGKDQIVTVNRGRNDGLDPGTVLELYRFGPTVIDRTGNKERVKLPDQQYGSLFIFRVFDRISYGLVMQVTDAVKIGDLAKSPE